MPIQLENGHLEEINPDLLGKQYEKGWYVYFDGMDVSIGAVLEKHDKVYEGNRVVSTPYFEAIAHHADNRLNNAPITFESKWSQYKTPEEIGQYIINKRIRDIETVDRLKQQTQDKPDTGEEEMGDKAVEAVKAMQKGAARKVKARLTRRAKNTMKQFCKQAQNMIEDIEPGKKSFPDGNLRKAIRDLMGSLEDNLEAVKQIAEAAGEDQLVEIIEEAADALAPADPNEGMEHEPEDHGEDVDIMGLSEGEDEASVDIGSIDETPIV